MYNVPSRTGVNIEPVTAISIAEENENIIAIKEASGNISQIAEIAAANILDIYSGNDDQIVPILSLGGIGVISVLANIFPYEVHEMVIKYLNGDINDARKLQLESLKLCKALFSDVNPIPIKKAMKYMDMDSGILREPLTELNKEKTTQLENEINKCKNYIKKI